MERACQTKNPASAKNRAADFAVHSTLLVRAQNWAENNVIAKSTLAQPNLAHKAA
jgi:hypothetical protein